MLLSVLQYIGIASALFNLKMQIFFLRPKHYFDRYVQCKTDHFQIGLGVVKQLWGQKGNHGMDLLSTKLCLKLLENKKAVPSTSVKLLGLCLIGYVCKT